MIENIWALCGGKPSVDELPYWEAINRYLAGLDPDGFQDIICGLCRRLLRSRAFEGSADQGEILAGHHRWDINTQQPRGAGREVHVPHP